MLGTQKIIDYKLLEFNGMALNIYNINNNRIRNIIFK